MHWLEEEDAPAVSEPLVDIVEPAIEVLVAHTEGRSIIYSLSVSQELCYF